VNWEKTLKNELKNTNESIRKRESELDTCNGSVADENDAATLNETRSIIQSDLKRLYKKREQLLVGLERVKDGDFGFCEECGIDIPTKRLELNPACTSCVDCKSEAELKSRQFSAHLA